MDLIDIQGFSLLNLDKFNVVLGKNGSGKSFMLEPACSNNKLLGLPAL